MRRLFLALSFMLPACIGDTADVINGAVSTIDPLCGTSVDGADPLCTDDTDANEYVNITEDCVTCPRIMVPASAVKPEVHIVSDFQITDVEEFLAVSFEQQNCPTRPIHQPLLERTYTALLDPSNADKFDGWQQSKIDTGTLLEATWSHQGSFYKLLWIDNLNSADPGLITIWQRTGSPFSMGLEHQTEYQGTYTDVNLTGCVNFGIGWEAKPGKMQWNDGDQWQIQYHDDWQQHYQDAVIGLATVLKLR